MGNNCLTSVPKELASLRGLTHSGELKLDERASGARAPLVDRPSDVSAPAATWPGDDNEVV